MTIKVAVVGAGNIGCAIGVQLLHAGLDTTLIARPQIAADIAANGLRLSDYRGQQWHRTASQVPVSTTLDATRDATLVLLAVKCADVHATAAALAPQLRAVVAALHLGSVLRRVRPERNVANLRRLPLPSLDRLVELRPLRDLEYRNGVLNDVLRPVERLHNGC